MIHKSCKKVVKIVDNNLCEVCKKPIREPKEEDIREAIKMFRSHPFYSHTMYYEDGTKAMTFSGVNPNKAVIAVLGREQLQEMGVWEDFLAGKFKHLEE